MTTKIRFTKIGGSTSMSLVEMFDRYEIVYYEDIEMAISPMFRSQHVRKVVVLGCAEEHRIRTESNLKEVKEHIERLFEEGLIVFETQTEWVDE